MRTGFIDPRIRSLVMKTFNDLVNRDSNDVVDAVRTREERSDRRPVSLSWEVLRPCGRVMVQGPPDVPTVVAERRMQCSSRRDAHSCETFQSNVDLAHIPKPQRAPAEQPDGPPKMLSGIDPVPR
jgi:hypothetical protein